MLGIIDLTLEKHTHMHKGKYMSNVAYVIHILWYFMPLFNIYLNYYYGLIKNELKIMKIKYNES